MQIFRNGIIEANTNDFANDHYGLVQPRKENFIYTDYEKEILVCLANYLQLQRNLTIPIPIIVFLSMIEVKSYIMGCDSQLGQVSGNSIDRDNLIFPEVMIEDYTVDLYATMKPIFDTVWNATGYPRSLNYDEQGNWISSHGV